MTSLSKWEAGLAAEAGTPEIPSVAYGVAKGAETLALGGFGATPQTPYALASVTKPMTATAVLLLAERGLVDLDAPADPRLWSTVGDPREATVRRVLSHTAGLPLHYRFYYADEPVQRPMFEETLRRYGRLFAPPGERFLYSNLGYGVLDDLVARVSGVAYARFMADETFGPLGMADAAIGRPERGAVPTSPEGLPYPPYTTDHPGGSDAWASAEDLLAFGRFHLGFGPSLLTPEARRSMREAAGYGLGWQVADRHGLRVVGHTGAMGGVRTVLRLVPERDLVIAVLVNGEGDLPWRAADDILAALDEGFAAGLRAEREAVRPPSDGGLPKEIEGEWRGRIETYAGDRALSLRVGEGEVGATLDGVESRVEEARIVGGRFAGVFDGDLGTDDAARRPYRVHLDLGLEGRGAAVAISAPGPRLGDALSYGMELTQV